MSTPIAMIPYANMAPYRQLGPPENGHFVPQLPRESIRALQEGRVVAAAVPVGGLARLSDCVETVGPFGIAARGASMSVLLFSRVPLAQMQAPRTLRLTSESATSVRLLYLLLGQSVGFDKLPQVTTSDSRPDATLLIGDRALVNGLASNTAWACVTDLSQAWFERHRRPFVFARWVVRKDASEAVKGAIANWLNRFKSKESELVEQAVPGSAARLQLDEEVIRRYFQTIRRSLDDEDLAGQAFFCEQFEQFGREPLFEATPTIG